MLEDSVTFELSSLAPLKGKKYKRRFPQKRAISKTSISDVVSINSQMTYVCNKNCKNKNSKTKPVVPFVYSPFIL